ncbi:paraquat-inducible protein B [Mannheimia haemolytica]|uniref:Paraquat-inducible protein B n=1 Tax=Mannheimia haemolytica TaxID=75985 RepID=A0A378NAU2_MANHA|nr:paraquat-inducible protein B [Mannheimia haemolytica]
MAVTIVAFIIGALLFFQILKEQGETITIRFSKGDGITAGKTAIRYQGLQIGQVKRVYFVDNLKEVEVQAEINLKPKVFYANRLNFG